MIVVHNWKEIGVIPQKGESYRIGPAIQTVLFRIGNITIAKVDKEDISGYKRIFGNSFYVVL